jgi:hypothetical protein
LAGNTESKKFVSGGDKVPVPKTASGIWLDNLPIPTQKHYKEQIYFRLFPTSTGTSGCGQFRSLDIPGVQPTPALPE